MKTCSKCKQEKSVEEFNRYSRSRDGLQPRCRSCQKDYHQTNREERLERQKIHYQANRDEIIARNIEYNRTRLTNDPTFRWVRNIRSRLSHILHGTRSNPEALELLGCTGEEWREHLESTFKPGMTWDNHGQGEGKWECDHIIPVSSFDQEDHLQRLICWNYRNTQALWSHENMAKGDTISTEGGAA